MDVLRGAQFSAGAMLASRGWPITGGAVYASKRSVNFESRLRGLQCVQWVHLALAIAQRRIAERGSVYGRRAQCANSIAFINQLYDWTRAIATPKLSIAHRYVNHRIVIITRPGKLLNGVGVGCDSSSGWVVCAVLSLVGGLRGGLWRPPPYPPRTPPGTPQTPPNPSKLPYSGPPGGPKWALGGPKIPPKNPPKNPPK